MGADVCRYVGHSTPHRTGTTPGRIPAPPQEAGGVQNTRPATPYTDMPGSNPGGVISDHTVGGWEATRTKRRHTNMAQAKTQSHEPTVETIADAGLWEAIADGVNTIGHDEGVFIFKPDRFEVAVKDAATVALIRQRVDATDFEHYDVEDTFSMGINTQRFEDLLGVVDDVPVQFEWDWDVYTFRFQAEDVEYDLSGLDVKSVNGSPADVPPPKDEYDFCVDATLPTEKFVRASKVVDMNTDHATFVMGGDGDQFVIEGKGDNDASRVTIHEDDRFSWNEDPPEDERVCRQANGYVEDVAGLIEEDTFRMVTGGELPYHIWTTRHDGVIDTKFIQAPRISKS